MAFHNHQPSPKVSSSDSEIADEKRGVTHEHVSPDRAPMQKTDDDDDDVGDLQYPEPWKYGKYFPGGYGQSRMLKFKKPKTMYTAINLFAGVAIMFYG